MWVKIIFTCHCIQSTYMNTLKRFNKSIDSLMKDQIYRRKKSERKGREQMTQIKRLYFTQQS